MTPSPDTRFDTVVVLPDDCYVPLNRRTRRGAKPRFVIFAGDPEGVVYGDYGKGIQKLIIEPKLGEKE